MPPAARSRDSPSGSASRLPATASDTFFRAFESGANGIMVPHVLDAGEARGVVRNAKFAPDGSRGIDGIEAHADHGLQPFDAYIAQANRETFVVVQIEDAAGVENVEE